MRNLYFNNKILFLIPVIFLLVIVAKISYAYYDLQAKQYNLALTKAQILNTSSLSYRKYYEEKVLAQELDFNKETFSIFLSHSFAKVSQLFTQDNSFDIRIRTVNKHTLIDKDEKKAIAFFKDTPDAKEYFSDTNLQFYQFGYILEKKHICTDCSPSHINSDDVGITLQSIQIPKNILDSHVTEIFIYSLIFDMCLSFVVFLGIFILIKKSSKINEYLYTEIQEKTKDLKSALVIDRLTKIPNRLQLLEDLQEIKKEKSAHIALININSFKDINEFYGHKSGDLVIQTVVQNIQSLCTQSKASLYKLPSDEFAILSKERMSENDFYQSIKHVMYTLQNTPIDTPEQSINIALSAGISSKMNALLSTANMALKLAKKDSANIIIYDASIDTSKNTQNNIQELNLLKYSLKNDQVIPFFQPIYNVHSKKVEKYESLVRIVQDNGNILAPYYFLDTAIKSKLYSQITRLMIEKSFAFFQDGHYEFSINLSIHDINNTNTKEFIIEKLRAFSYPEKIVFEILESDKVEDYEALKEFIKEIKVYGCKFAIDDFGSGYSNFSHVLKLNIDYLKIDASLVKFITTDENSRTITRTIIHFASTLGLQTIAEFVEDKDALEMLEEMGIDYIQGYYIGKPEARLNSRFK